MSEIKVDTVAEKTSANGVTIDGLNIKDSKLVTANSVVTSNVTDANITTAKIADVNVTEGKIADNAITLAKMASGTDGNIISYDASGNPVAVATGNDGQVLTSTGAGSPPAFETLPAGGSWVLLDTQTASGNPSTLEPSAVFSSTYDTYVMIIRRINLQSNGGLSLYIGTSSGFVTSGYKFAGSGVAGGANDTYSGSAGDIPLLGGTSSAYHCNTTADCLSGVIWFHNPFNDYRTSIHGEMSWENATDLKASINNFSAHPNTNASYDRWKLAPSSGTFQSNTIIQTFGVVNA